MKISVKCCSVGVTAGAAALSWVRKESLMRDRNLRDSSGERGSGGWRMEENRLKTDLVRETRVMLVGFIVGGFGGVMLDGEWNQGGE